MGAYQTFRGNPEKKLLYTVDQLIGGVNTDFSDDASPDNEFQAIVNFTMDKRGSLYKRKGFGKQTAISQILNMFDHLPDVKITDEDIPHPETNNDNIVYARLLRDDNSVFRELAKYEGINRPYRAYQMAHGKENNNFTLLFITTNYVTKKSKSWLYSCTLPDLIYNESGLPLPNETIILNEKIVDLPVEFTWNRNLKSIETIDFFDSIYLTSNNFGLTKFDINSENYEYYGPEKNGVQNKAYKPNPMEIRKVGFNVLGNDPLRWVDYQSLSTDSIQGVYLTYNIKGKDTPTLTIPSGGKFKINVLYTGNNANFTITFKEGEADISASVNEVTSENQTGLKVYNVTLKNVPTSEVEIKVVKSGANVDPYYDYYSVGKIDIDAKPLEPLNLGDYGICEMYNRAVYYKEDTIWFSAINNFSYVPNYNYVVLPIDKTDKITKIIFFRNVYIIFTKFRIYKMIGAFGTPEFTVMPVNLAIGCHAPNTIVPIENELYFASTRGLYSLKSSEFRDGIENLKEIDTKVKRLTSEVTTDVGDLDYRSYSFNGIQDIAYAIRYKDQYILFYNTEMSSEDYKDVTKIDALVYNYTLKAYTEIKFPARPTFIFMIDNRITTYCQYPVKEEYTKEDVLFNYNFDTLKQSDRVVKDTSGNGFNADLVGDAYGNRGLGISFNDQNGYITNKGFSNDIDKSLKIKFRANIQPGDTGTLLDLRQSNQSGADLGSQTFKIETDPQHGYKAIMNFKTVPNLSSNQTLVYWSLTYYRNSTSISNRCFGDFYLQDQTSGKSLINLTKFEFNMPGDDLSYPVGNGSFTVTHDSVGEYTKDWVLVLKGGYEIVTKYWENGSPISFDVRQAPSWNNGNFGIRVAGNSTVKNGECTIRCTPYLSLAKYGILNVGARTMKIWVAGELFERGIRAVTSSGSEDIAGAEIVKKVNYTGTSTAHIDAQYPIRATISGTYRENIDIDGFNINLPRTEQKTKVDFDTFIAFKSKTVTLTELKAKSYRPIRIKILNNKSITIYLEDENTNTEFSIDASNDYFDGNNITELSFINIGSQTRVEFLVNGAVISAKTINYVLKNGNRNVCKLFSNFSAKLSYYSISANSNNVFEYTIMEGVGTTLYDKTGNNITGKINGSVTWLVKEGLSFNGGYMVIPTLPANIRFTNGFSIEFDLQLANVTKNRGVILNLATTQDAKDKCFIQVYYENNGNSLGFLTTTLQASGYKTVLNNADLVNKHTWKLELKDTGTGYTFKIYCDNKVKLTERTNYGVVENIARAFNNVGRDVFYSGTLKGVMHFLKLTVYASASPIKVYEGAIFEYDTSFTDFNKNMDILIETKGINVNYPLHVKKLKNVFIKGLGGYDYNKFFFELYSDGHIVNDPRKYFCYIDETTRQVVYDYTEDRNLEFSEKYSRLDFMRLDKTRLGDSNYETKKMIVPAKGKNFAVKIYGKSGDYMKIESFGFVFKLGKVRED